MKRTVREILAECKGGRELMSLRDFTLCIKTIHAHLNLACFSPDGSRESKRHLKMADDICLAVEDCFADQNSNLVNWFRREPCEFHHPLTGSYVKVEVRDDIEAIYYFLHYCMMLNQHISAPFMTQPLTITNQSLSVISSPAGRWCFSPESRRKSTSSWMKRIS